MPRIITRPAKNFTTDSYKANANVATSIAARVVWQLDGAGKKIPGSDVQEYTATVRVHLDGGRGALDVPVFESDLSAADIAKVEAAIEARTKDWGFHELKAGLLMAQGDLAGADRAFADSESLVRDQISKGGDCTLLARNMFTHRINALETQLGLQPNDQLRTKSAETQAQLDALAADQPISFCS